MVIGKITQELVDKIHQNLTVFGEVGWIEIPLKYHELLIEEGIKPNGEGAIITQFMGYPVEITNKSYINVF